jgi:RNA polymerase sigma-70 factor (sigma-E family)
LIGPGGSFEEFVAAQGATLLRYAYLLTQDRGRAEDLVQGALVKTHRRWHAVIRAERPEAYVRRIVLNEYLSWRRRKSSHEVIGAPPDTSVADRTDLVADQDQMWRTLATLPPRQRAVLVLRYYEDMTDAEIASALNCQPGTVRSQAVRALDTLRRRPGWGTQEQQTAPAEEH